MFQIALQFLPLLQLIVIFQTSEILAYSLPIYGTKRYGRTNQRSSTTSYDPYSSYQVVPRYVDPVSYYKNPYTDTYHSNYYYPQDTYPMPYYYPKVYRPLPYYYQEHSSWPNQGYAAYYDYNDPTEDYLQDTERDDRELTQPIGHESYYEDIPEDSNMEDVNAAFLQNLILTQMYQDSVNNKLTPDNYDDYDETFAKLEELSKKPTHAPEDETVRELKQLQKATREKENKKNKNNNVHWAQANQGQESRQQRKNRQRKQKQETKRGALNTNELPLPVQEGSIYSERKPVIKYTSSTVAPSTDASVKDSRGQKEQFEVRPATPVRHAFSSPVLTMMSRSDQERKRAPSVYDTIKHLLDMEKSLENVSI